MRPRAESPRASPRQIPVLDGAAVEGLVISTGYSGHGLGIAPGAGR
jgi:glycine/D-amino acid oxidase-like deaminating enzyme